MGGNISDFGEIQSRHKLCILEPAPEIISPQTGHKKLEASFCID